MSSRSHAGLDHAPVDKVETLIDVAEKMGLEMDIDNGVYLPDGTVVYDGSITFTPSGHTDEGQEGEQ